MLQRPMGKHSSGHLTLFIWSLSVGLALVQASCLEAGFRDLGDSILDPNAALLDRPGRKLAAGSYSGLTIDGSLEDGGRVLAYKHDKNKVKLSVIPFLDGKSCEYAPVVSFERISSKVDIELDAIVAVQTTGETGGPGTLEFIDFNCQETLPALEDAYLPRVAFPSKNPRGVLAVTSEGDLYLLDAIKREQILVSTGVSQTSVNSSTLWTLEAGELVARGKDLKVKTRLGKNVTSYVFGPGGDDDEIIYLDDDGLSGWSEEHDVRAIARDVCSPYMLTSQVLAYFSPCAERRLILDVPAESVGRPSKEGRVTLRGPGNVLPNIWPIVRFGFEGKSSRILVIQGDDPGQTAGRLLALDIAEAPEFDDDGFVVPSEQDLGDDFTLVGSDLFRNHSGEAGDLYTILEDDDHVISGVLLVQKSVALLPGSAAFSGRGILTQFDRTTRTGRLARIEVGEQETDIELLTERVPLQQFIVEPETSASAFVGELDSDFGRAFFFEKGKKPKAVADKALLNTLRFLEEPRALVYLAPSSLPGTELHAYLIESGIDLKVAHGVTEYRGLPWPAPGILYAIWEGDNAGIWFSKAR